MATERKTIVVGEKFNPAVRAHVERLIAKVVEEHDPGWEFQSFDPARSEVTVIRHTVVTQVTKASKGDTYEVELGRDVKPSDGEMVSARLETDERHRGYVMTEFKPYLFRATLSKLSEAEISCRGAVATAIGVKPWEVQVASRPDGGFHLGLPPRYVPSKHDKALGEVATVIVGRPGWYFTFDPASYTAELIPSEPPTFPAAVPFPMGSLARADIMETPFGVRLPPPGSTSYEPVVLDWGASPWCLIAGTPGSGKSVLLNAIIASQLSAGAELVICDVPDKKVDFLWMKQWCRDGGWGADSDLATLAALQIVYEEGKRRSKVIEEHGVTNWLELPPSVRFRPIDVIVDEVSGLLVTEKLPAGVPKDNPIVQAKIARNLVRVSIDDVITRIIAEQRAFGIRMILSTQVTNNNTGVGPTTKAKLGNKFLLGSNPSKTQRVQAFSTEDRVPTIPDNISADVAAARGAGAAELEGQEPFVYKTYYASTKEYSAALTQLGVPISNRPEPTPAEIARYDPTIDNPEDFAGEGSSSSRGKSKQGFGYGPKQPRDDGLSGAAAAAHDLRMVEAVAARESRNAAAAARAEENV